MIRVDTGLVERARAGDRAALDRLIRTHKPDLERYARRHCQSDDVEEAVQDALWILHRRLGGLRSLAAFAGWLYQVTRRTCLKLALGRRRDVGLEALPPYHERDELAADHELRAILSQLIAALPQPYREVLVLKDVQGLSADEIAKLLGVSPEAAKSRLHRARAMVREALADAHSGEHTVRRVRA